MSPESTNYSKCPFCNRKYLNGTFLARHIEEYHPVSLKNLHLYLKKNYNVTILSGSGSRTINQIINDISSLIEDSNGKFIIRCLNCDKPLEYPIPLYLLKFFESEFVKDSTYPIIFFCSDHCQSKYPKLKRGNKTSGWGTAPFSEDYRDQYDWNR